MGAKSEELWYLENANLQELFCPMDGVVQGHSPLKTFKKGEFIYLPNDDSGKVFYLADGRVKIGSYSETGKEILKTVLHGGDIFGEFGLIGQQKRNEFAQAMQKSHLCVMPLAKVREIMETKPEFGLKITQLIGHKLLSTQRRLEALVFKDVRTRVIEFLRDLGREKGQRVGYETLVRNFFTHQEIASLTGTSRQTVTTILNELRADNHIHFDRKRLLIRDLERLGGLV